MVVLGKGHLKGLYPNLEFEKLRKITKMKKNLRYLLFAVGLTLMVGCAKDEDTLTVVSSEAQISNETGLSFVSSSGFTADYVTYKLRLGTGVEKEYGQSLVGYNYTEMQEGSKTIYQIEVYKDGEPLSFKAYVNNEEGGQTEVKSTSIIDINNEEILKILLDHQ